MQGCIACVAAHTAYVPSRHCDYISALAYRHGPCWLETLSPWHVVTQPGTIPHRCDPLHAMGAHSTMSPCAVHAFLYPAQCCGTRGQDHLHEGIWLMNSVCKKYHNAIALHKDIQQWHTYIAVCVPVSLAFTWHQHFIKYVVKNADYTCKFQGYFSVHSIKFPLNYASASGISMCLHHQC